jgi:hypothetical protein
LVIDTNSSEGYGQNLAASIPNANVSAQLSEGWYNGEEPVFSPYYGIDNPAVSEETFEKYGHFTQMVWKDTTSVGCATYDCRGASGDFKMWYTVCNYYPAGTCDGLTRARNDKLTRSQATTLANTPRTSATPSAIQPATGTRKRIPLVLTFPCS